jgi:hypothetical protein
MMHGEEWERQMEATMATLKELAAKHKLRGLSFEEAQVALRELVRKARRERRRKRKGKKDGSDPGKV